jgi:arsenate reductase-like glutaredoxin family protein
MATATNGQTAQPKLIFPTNLGNANKTTDGISAIATTDAKAAVEAKIKKNIHVLLDQSGSMANIRERQILRLLTLFIDNPDFDLKITFFGEKSHAVIVHSALTACKAYKADGSTYTDEIRNLFAFWRKMKIYPEFLVFIGDGVFNDTNFMKHITDHADVFTKLINFVLAFPCTVSEEIQQTLLTELTQVICNTHLATNVYIKCFNYDCPSTALLDLINSANLTGNAQELILPEGYTCVGTLFGFITGMTAYELATEIKLITEHQTLIEDLLKFMQNVITSMPQVLLANKVYIILHKLLHILCKEVYSEWIQTHQRSLDNKSSQYIALSGLIIQSFKDRTMIISMYNQIKDLIIGFAQFNGINQPTSDELLAMLRSKGIGIEEMLKKLFKLVSVVPISETNAREYTLEHIMDHPELCGMPVLSSNATPDECRLALRLCFLQIDVLPLSEHIGWILSMILLTSNYILHEEIINMVRKSFLGDDAYTRRMIGISYDNKHEWVDVLCSMKLSISLSRVLKQFCRQMFSPESLVQLAPIIKNIYALAMGHIVVNAIRNIIKSNLEAKKNIEHTVPIDEEKPDNKFNIGDIILIRFTGDPAPNLPGCVVVIAVTEGGTVILEFLDKERNGKDIHTIRNIFVLPPRNYVKLYTRAPLALQNELNKRLIQMVSDMGPFYGAPYDDTIYNKNLDIVKAILYTKGTRIVTTTYSAQIPNANIIKILGLGGMPADILSIIYNNANLNKEQLISIVRFLTTPQIKQDDDAIHSFICKDGEFIISPELCETIRSTFNKILQSITSDFTTTLRTLGNVWCSLCLSDNHYTNSARYGCGEHHWACLDCMSSFIEQGVLPHGTLKFIESSCYTCPDCKGSISSNPNIDPRVNDLMKLYPGGLPERTRFRPCKECDIIFAQDLACGGDDTRLNTLCEVCIPPVPNGIIMACPGCSTPIIDHDGCEHITCPNPGCNTHYCFGCKYIFTEEQIKSLDVVWWECFGNCNDANVNKKLNLDNDSDGW